MIKGYDVSNVNGFITIPGDAEFVIAKVSQDSAFVDRIFPLFRRECRLREIGFGGYHYADNRAQTDARKSCEFYLGHLGTQHDGEIGALDVEGDYGYGGFDPNNPENLSWVALWGQVFIEHQGYKAKLYTSVAGLTDYDLIHDEIPELFDLWLAYWPNNGHPVNPPPAPAPFTDYKLWQYNADTIDKNEFFGDLELFKSLGKQPKTPSQHAYEAEYWTPIYDLVCKMNENPQYPHADAAFHAAISNAITLHKVALDVEPSK